MTPTAAPQLRQRAEFTHRHNVKLGRHGWLRLTPAYSVQIVEDLIGAAETVTRVFDPFCGTGTTALSAAYHGLAASTTDINPFLIWLGRAKTAQYSKECINQTHECCENILSLVGSRSALASELPPIHNIERWWPPEAIAFLSRLRAALYEDVPSDAGAGALLRIAFCRTLIACSNAAFNHQSMSFKSSPQVELGVTADLPSLFREHVRFVLIGARENPSGHAEVLLHDARELSSLRTEPFDMVVTSPPYANRMSYIRELRPYMYWMEFLVNAREAGELDWLAIGGTWGIATSRLSDWKPASESYTSEEMAEVLSRVAHPDNANGALLSKYIHKYCDDMARHLAELRAILKSGAELHYIVGNSTFYGELISVEQIYADVMSTLGFTDVLVRPIRKRNSKKELVEFDVSARWP